MKQIFFLLILSILCLYNIFKVTGARWTSEEANNWYEHQPWFFGANFIPSNAVNVIDMWQTFDITTIERELKWASQINMNIMRVFLHFLLYQHDAEDYYKKLDEFLTIADKYNIKIMFVLFDECWLPNPKLGPQPDPIPGVHNSQWVQCPGQTYVQNNSTWYLLKQYTNDILGRFSNDSRVVIWDLYNEPESGRHLSNVLPLLNEIYSTAVIANPQQPLTFGLASGIVTSPLAKFELASSDIISFHNYGPLVDTMQFVSQLRQFNRPLLCSEYIARTIGSTFHIYTFYFRKQRIGAINWGLVAGKTQTYFPWGSPVNALIPLVWFHDIFNVSGEPFSPYEIQFFKDLTGKISQSFSVTKVMVKLATSLYRLFIRK